MQPSFNQHRAINSDILVYTKRLLTAYEYSSWSFKNAHQIASQEPRLYNPEFNKVLSDISADLEKPDGTKEYISILEKHVKVFSPFYIFIVRESERQGESLSQGLQKLLAVAGFEERYN